MEKTEGKLDILNPKYSFNYANGRAPETYRCQKCGKSHVRLWREEGFDVNKKYVYCADCLRLIYDGIEKELAEGLRIRSFIPAIPTEENNYFVGFGHITPSMMEWWMKLPLNS